MISIAMATYNGAKYLVEQLDSIRDQSVKPDEVIICDDCSSDNTAVIVNDYIEKNGLFGKWKFFVNKNNLGYGDNFNRIVNMTKGDYIFFSDQDDIWKLDKIEKMIAIMENNEDCTVLCTDYEPFASEDKAPVPPKVIMDRMPDDGRLEKIKLSNKSIYIGALGCCMCVRRKFYEEIKDYWFDGWAQDDRMWKLSQCVDGCYLLHSNYVKHRLHGNNASTYGKYHSLDRRVALFKNMLNANRHMLSLAEIKLGKQASDILQKHIKMMEYRIDLMEKRKFWLELLLLKYLKYYENKKSFILELFIAIKGK